MSTVAFNYNRWNYWSIYDPANDLYGDSKVTFDGVNKLILVNYGETSLDFKEDVYSNWKEWIADPTLQNAQYETAISAVGGDPLPGDRALGTTFFLENGWRMRTWEGDHELTVTGNVFTRTGVSLFVPTLESWTITINLNTSTLVETILPSLSLGADDIAAVADATWAETLSGTSAGDRLIALATALANVDQDVWDYIIDSDKSQSAGDKLKKIATKTQDIALS